MRASGPTREREPVDIQVGACLPTRAPLQLQTIDIEIFINFHPYKSGEAAELFFSESWYLTLSPHKVYCFRNPISLDTAAETLRMR